MAIPKSGALIDSETLELLPTPKRIRIRFGDTWLADSLRAKLLREKGHLPVYYFPREDIRTDLLEPSDRRTHCPRKGDATYWTIKVGDRIAENAGWSYDTPLEQAQSLKDHVAFYWDKVDAWFEEDEEVRVHPHDPYHRIDVLRSSRHVKVMLAGEIVAESHRPTLLFETGLPARYYLPRVDVRLDLLVPSHTSSECPYKGEAEHYSVRTGNEQRDDLLWSYPFPRAEALGIAGLFCFYHEKIDGFFVDGKKL